MSTTRRTFMGGMAAIGALSLAACGGGSSSGSDASGKPEGEILVLTNRTDVVNTLLKGYAKKFTAKYPDVTVKFQALSDYEGEVKTRMNTKQYGDVLLIPASVGQKDYPSFFEPLGSVADLEKKYNFIGNGAVDGKAYGLATFGNATGTVYNKEVMAKAGMKSPPTTPEELIALLKKVKEQDGVTPYYTNYKDGWPLSWPEGFMGSISGDPDALVKLSKEKSPWTGGTEKATLDSLLYDLVAAGLTEKDPTTTNWENSKNLIATGKIGMMPLGSWALPQMQDAAKSAGKDPKNIGFMPPPFQVGGSFSSPTGPDFLQAININSEHKAAAKAWIEWSVNDSGYYDVVGGLPTVKSKPPAAALKEFQESGAKFVPITPSPALNAIDKASEIGLTQPDYYRDLVDSARGASGTTKEAIFKKLNDKWATGLKDVG